MRISKTILTVIITGLIGIWQALISNGVNIPDIPAWVLTILAALGLYGLRDAIKRSDVKMEDLKEALKKLNK